MSAEQEIEAAAAAIEEALKREDGQPPFKFYPRELKRMARAAIGAASQVRQKAAADDIKQAASVSLALCDFCPAVHINLIDDAGALFASASIPCDLGAKFVGDFQQLIIKAAVKISAPARRQ